MLVLLQSIIELTAVLLQSIPVLTAVLLQSIPVLTTLLLPIISVITAVIAELAFLNQQTCVGLVAEHSCSSWVEIPTSAIAMTRRACTSYAGCVALPRAPVLRNGATGASL